MGSYGALRGEGFPLSPYFVRAYPFCGDTPQRPVPVPVHWQSSAPVPTLNRPKAGPLELAEWLPPALRALSQFLAPRLTAGSPPSAQNQAAPCGQKPRIGRRG